MQNNDISDRLKGVATLPTPGEWEFQGKNEGLDCNKAVEKIEDLAPNNPFRKAWEDANSKLQ